MSRLKNADYNQYVTGDFSKAAGDFSAAVADYDLNGNMISDKNKGITEIQYNYLNLPQRVNVDGKGTISYVYDAAGSKLKKITNDNATGKQTVTLYLGAAQYVDDQLQFFGNSEGRTRVKDNGYVLDYFLKDHLGNTRLVISDQPGLQSPVLEETHYYPFGLTKKGISSSQSTASLQNKYQYNGKELQQSDLGLDQYDYGARFYDPKIGRWHVQDPMAEDEDNDMWTLYNYVKNNPILRIDPDGMQDTTKRSSPLPPPPPSGNKLPDVIVRYDLSTMTKASHTNVATSFAIPLTIPLTGSAVQLKPVEVPPPHPILIFIFGILYPSNWGHPDGSASVPHNPAILYGKGERGKTAKPEGTDNPYKKLRPHPTDPRKVKYKDPHSGKDIDMPKPEGFDEWWNKKRGTK